MVGELYIGGLRLTSGYLNRSELNQEKFIENPYVTPEDKAEGINTRLYKSGDLVRRRSDGHLIFMGRTDSQVKLRGFRVELAEIESLLQHAWIPCRVSRDRILAPTMCRGTACVGGGTEKR